MTANNAVWLMLATKLRTHGAVAAAAHRETYRNKRLPPRAIFAWAHRQTSHFAQARKRPSKCISSIPLAPGDGRYQRTRPRGNRLTISINTTVPTPGCFRKRLRFARSAEARRRRRVGRRWAARAGSETIRFVRNMLRLGPRNLTLRCWRFLGSPMPRSDHSRSARPMPVRRRSNGRVSAAGRVMAMGSWQISSGEQRFAAVKKPCPVVSINSSKRSMTGIG